MHFLHCHSALQIIFCRLLITKNHSLLVSNVPVNFFELSSTEFAASSKPSIRDKHRKASYPKAQERDQGGVKPRSCDQRRCNNVCEFCVNANFVEDFYRCWKQTISRK